MNPSTRRVLGLVLLPWILAAAACTSMQTVSAPTDEAVEKVGVGDTVRVVTADGRDLIMDVRTLDREVLEGDVSEVQVAPEGDVRPGQSVRIPLAEVRSLQVRRVDGWKTAGFLGGSVVLAYLIGALLVTSLVIMPY